MLLLNKISDIVSHKQDLFVYEFIPLLVTNSEDYFPSFQKKFINNSRMSFHKIFILDKVTSFETSKLQRLDDGIHLFYSALICKRYCSCSDCCRKSHACRAGQYSYKIC